MTADSRWGWWRSPAVVPASLAIPDLGIRAPIAAVGVRADGALDLPDRPDALGWYAAGPRPGDGQGSAVVAGHLDSREGELGPFADLRRLTGGARLVVTDAAGVATEFTVTGLQVVDREELARSGVFRAEGEPVLTLITCTGSFDRARGMYPQNLVVTAAQRV